MSNVLLYVIIVIIFYIIIIQFKADMYTEFMEGFWTSDPSFCDESNIQDMIFYINNESKTIKILIQQEEKNLENSTYDIQLSKLVNTNNLTIYNDCIEYNLVLTHQNDDDKNNIMDGEYLLYLSLSKGILTLYKDDVIYAMLYKDSLSTSKLL
jgi:hypothetical protein